MSIRKKISKKINNIKVAVALGMASADKAILKADDAKVPEGSSIVSQNFSSRGFIRSIQQGKFTEEQIFMYNKLLGKMDKFESRLGDGRYEIVYDDNGKQEIQDGEVVKKWVPGDYKEVKNPETGETETIWVPRFKKELRKLYSVEGNPIMEEIIDENGKTVKVHKEEWVDIEDAFENLDIFLTKKQALGDYVEGYRTIFFFVNKIIPVGITQQVKWSFIFNREYITFGRPKIEDFCYNSYVKIQEEQDFKSDKNCLVEFYCHNYNMNTLYEGSSDGTYDKPPGDDCYDTLINRDGLRYFIDFENFSAIEFTSTSNDKVHNFKVTAFKEIKKLDKGFVLKMWCEKI